ncbi:MAG: GNAT family N-acetyltransferase [Actinomycetes bacterium]
MNSSAAYSIRFAQAADETSILQLRTRATVEGSQFRGLVPVSEIGDISVLAEIGQSIVGYLSYSVQGSSANITSVHVHAEAREVGIGDALVLFTISECKKANLQWISASAQPGDRDLKNLFERHGLVAQRIIVGKSLSDPSTEEHASQ